MIGFTYFLFAWPMLGRMTRFFFGKRRCNIAGRSFSCCQSSGLPCPALPIPCGTVCRFRRMPFSCCQRPSPARTYSPAPRVHALKCPPLLLPPAPSPVRAFPPKKHGIVFPSRSPPEITSGAAITENRGQVQAFTVPRRRHQLLGERGTPGGGGGRAPRG